MRRTKNISLVTVICVVSFGIVVARFGIQLSLSVGSDLIPLSCSLFGRIIPHEEQMFIRSEKNKEHLAGYGNPCCLIRYSSCSVWFSTFALSGIGSHTTFMLSLFARMIDRAKKNRTNEKFGGGKKS